MLCTQKSTQSAPSFLVVSRSSLTGLLWLQDEPEYYPRESLPDGYLWETPYSSEMLADSVVILSNIVGAAAIVT